jgi:DNA invertase Pin-like site-specific DNA recombinase
MQGRPSTNIFNSKRQSVSDVQKKPLSKELHGQLIRAGQARARAEGRLGGRPLVYQDVLIRDAIRRHEAGETWAAAAAALGISLENLYTRLRKLRREDANAKAT